MLFQHFVLNKLQEEDVDGSVGMDCVTQCLLYFLKPWYQLCQDTMFMPSSPYMLSFI